MPDCDMFLTHDDDLERIDGIGDGTVSGYLISSYRLNVLISRPAVAGRPQTRRDGGPPPEV
jgi:hypothetical protein